MSVETLVVTIKDSVGTIVLNRPERLNSFDIQLGQELYYTLHQIRQNQDVRVVVLRGAGNGFCGGGDIKEMFAAADKPKFLRKLTQMIHRCVLEMRSMEKPIIIGVNGSAFGAGLSLALAGDIIIAVKGIKLGTAFIGIGLAPGCGTQFFTRLVGYQKACEYIMTAKTFTVEEAEQLGIVNKVVDSEKFDDTIQEYCQIFKHLAPVAVGKAKMLINKSMENNMKNHLQLESRIASYSAGTEDFTEGITAFIEKRKPIFQGK
ncbi:MAG: enoyl-CoA hydratase/isomerase family protein [Candidatus Thermoplasmatota archaeon]